MIQRRRWFVAFAALVIGGAVSATLLVFANPERTAVDVYVAARDLPAGASLGLDAVAIERLPVAARQSLLFSRGDGSQLADLRASHDLLSGQLIQRSDAMDASSAADRRLVFVPVKDVPAAGPGAKVDLLVIGGTPDHPTVVPFALGVEVRAMSAGGLTVLVTSRQASAFVYAASAMRLVAVIAEPGAAEGAEGPVSSSGEAMAAAAQR
ncbi:MAG: SAF domain-containing protein [Candidatus Dormiibacterota bacterium]